MKQSEALRQAFIRAAMPKPPRRRLSDGTLAFLWFIAFWIAIIAAILIAGLL